MKITRLLVALLLVMIGIFAPRLNAAEPYKGIVPYTPLTGATTPFWIAIEARIFQKFGLEIVPLFVSAGSSVIIPTTRVR